MAEDRIAPNFRSALITGATGFLGGHLARTLHDGGVSVTVTTRPSSDPDRVAALAAFADIHTVTGETDDLVHGLKQAAPDAVFHLAARFLSHHTPGEITGLIADNVTFTAQLCQAAVAAQCTTLVAAGTAWQNAGSPQGEPTPAPNTLYAASKQAADDVIDYYSAVAGLNAMTLKIYDSYGPGDPRRKFLTVLRDAAAANETIDATPGDQQLHMVHVDDLVDGFIQAANMLASGAVRGRASHTLPSPGPKTLREIADIWMRANDAQVNINWGGRPHREGEVMVPWEGDPLPGWAPRIALESGLRGC